MERHAILDLMAKLKLRGMRAAFDEVITLGAKRQHSPERVVGDLLAAQLADVQARGTAYRMGNAKFPVIKGLSEFDFAASPVNAALVRALHRGDFLSEGRKDRKSVV